MPVSDLAGMTVTQVLMKAGMEGVAEWLRVEGNYERLAPQIAVWVENLVAGWEAAQEAASGQADA